MSSVQNESSNALSAPLPWQTRQWAQMSRALDSNVLSHAYLFSGSEGLGKSLFATAFARYVLCIDPREIQTTESPPGRVACGECSNCQKGGVGNHPDMLRIEPEEGGKNIKIDQVRRLSEFVIKSSHSGGAKLAIIEQAHLLNANAANALLKTLEEPNSHTHVILVSDHPGRLVATIRSRCQKLNFPTPEPKLTIPWLRNIVGDGNLDAILDASEGRPLTALQMADGDSFQLQEQFIQNLCAMKQGRISIHQALATSTKTGELELLKHFSRILTKLTKYCLTRHDEAGGNSALQSMYGLITESQDRAVLQSVAARLSRFYLEVETARKQLESTTNPNPQLILESILWHWSKLRLA